jgi:hypothetical protein
MTEGPRWRGRISILAGRATATGFTLLYLALVVGEGPGGAEGIGFLVLLGLVAAAVAVAWWSATMGVLALVTVGGALALFSAVAADRNPGLAAVVLGGPYVLSGLVVWFGVERMAWNERRQIQYISHS